MPRIKDVQPHLSEIVDGFKKDADVKEVYVWGSYASNILNLEHRLKDIDIMAKTKIISGDLLSISDEIIKLDCSSDVLENQGYNTNAIKFSQCFTALSQYNIDCWAISFDNKLLHWGPILANYVDSKNINNEAAEHAIRVTGLNIKKLSKSSEKNRKNWYDAYCDYKNQYLKDMPTGWYEVEGVKIKEILSKAILI
jgi:hypothetical protein